ncbi:MAG: hypothetical protein ACFFDT_14935 [Candidatus Hodarchaeota archaeon]
MDDTNVKKCFKGLDIYHKHTAFHISTKVDKSWVRKTRDLTQELRAVCDSGDWCAWTKNMTSDNGLAWYFFPDIRKKNFYT